MRRFSASPSAIADFEKALQLDEEGDYVPLKYSELKQDFKLADLSRDIGQSQPAWRSLMLYYGGLTFYSDDPANYLKIPNLIAAKRIAAAVLERYGLRHSLNSALKDLEINGNIQPVLCCYQDLMRQQDVGTKDFEASETIHRDSFYFSLVRNAFFKPNVEFALNKVRLYSNMTVAIY